MKEKLVELNERIHTLWKGLSAREHLLIVGGMLLIIGMGGYFVFKTVAQAFSEQEQRLTGTDTNMRTALALVSRYSRLRSLKDNIERKYKEVEIHEGVLSHLENVVHEIGGIEEGKITIQQKPVQLLGDNYEQAPFFVKFETTDFAKLVSVLRELSEGKHPLVIGRLNLERGRVVTNALSVELTVSSIRRVSPVS